MENSIGGKLRLLRGEKRLTQQEAADRIGMTRAKVANYETGRRTPPLPDLNRMASFYGVSLDFFGITPRDAIIDLTARAKRVFNDPAISKAHKDAVYHELLKLYRELEKRTGKE